MNSRNQQKLPIALVYSIFESYLGLKMYELAIDEWKYVVGESADFAMQP